MTNALVSQPALGNQSQTLISATAINEEHRASLACHLLFLDELSGGRGHGRVPTDPKERKRYLKSVRKILCDEYDLSDNELASLIFKYRRPDNGPILARRDLLARKPGKQ